MSNFPDGQTCLVVNTSEFRALLGVGGSRFYDLKFIDPEFPEPYMRDWDGTIYWRLEDAELYCLRYAELLQKKRNKMRRFNDAFPKGGAHA